MRNNSTKSEIFYTQFVVSGYIFLFLAYSSLTATRVMARASSMFIISSSSENNSTTLLSIIILHYYSYEFYRPWRTLTAEANSYQVYRHLPYHKTSFLYSHSALVQLAPLVLSYFNNCKSFSLISAKRLFCSIW